MNYMERTREREREREMKSWIRNHKKVCQFGKPRIYIYINTFEYILLHACVCVCVCQTCPRTGLDRHWGTVFVLAWRYMHLYLHRGRSISLCVHVHMEVSIIRHHARACTIQAFSRGHLVNACMFCPCMSCTSEIWWRFWLWYTGACAGTWFISGGFSKEFPQWCGDWGSWIHMCKRPGFCAAASSLGLERSSWLKLIANPVSPVVLRSFRLLEPGMTQQLVCNKLPTQPWKSKELHGFLLLCHDSVAVRLS